MTKLSRFERQQEQRHDHPAIILQADKDWRVITNRLSLDYCVQERERLPHWKTHWSTKSRFKTRLALLQHLKRTRRCGSELLERVERLPLVVGGRPR